MQEFHLNSVHDARRTQATTDPTLQDILDLCSFLQEWNEESLLEGSRLKSQCKAEFYDLLDEIRSWHRKQQVADRDIAMMYTCIVPYYVGCLIESEFEAKMAKWSNRLLKSWGRY